MFARLVRTALGSLLIASGAAGLLAAAASLAGLPGDPFPPVSFVLSSFHLPGLWVFLYLCIVGVLLVRRSFPLWFFLWLKTTLLPLLFFGLAARLLVDPFAVHAPLPGALIRAFTRPGAGLITTLLGMVSLVGIVRLIPWFRGHVPVWDEGSGRGGPGGQETQPRRTPEADPPSASVPSGGEALRGREDERVRILPEDSVLVRIAGRVKTSTRPESDRRESEVLLLEAPAPERGMDGEGEVQEEEGELAGLASSLPDAEGEAPLPSAPPAMPEPRASRGEAPGAHAQPDSPVVGDEGEAPAPDEEPIYLPLGRTREETEGPVAPRDTEGGGDAPRTSSSRGPSPSQGRISSSVEQRPRRESLSQESPGSLHAFEGPYRVPIEGILARYPELSSDNKEEIKKAGELLLETLSEFGIEAELIGIRRGPVITMYEILPAPGVKLSRIVNLADNIALRLAAQSVRIVAPIPGKRAVGVEVPNKHRELVSLREILEQTDLSDPRYGIPVILGKDITGEPQVVDLTQTPHLLIAGATGSGKSVCVNAIICSVLYSRSPREVRLMLIDPKIVELKLYNDIPHLLTPVVTDPKRAFQALQYCVYEMERRYALLDAVGARDIRAYNQKVEREGLAMERLPYIVIIIDEFADLMATAGKDLEAILARLAAMSRAVGLHLVLATQRPSIDVITGLIKANIPSRIAFMVASKFDSRIIIDSVGAEKLLGRGDMLFTSPWQPFPVRIQGAFVSEEEVERLVAYLKELGPPDYVDDEIFIDEEEDDPSLQGDLEDPLLERAIQIVVSTGKASASYLQRRLKIGYNRAARLVEAMEDLGIVGPANGSKPREILQVPPEYQGAQEEDL
ncbi:cell division FtsK/SpoIIIE [Spirochaeta thermophila DSM 6578]|uniref:Cell division FtsK/SpoIIIE n=1 Tax=Winmispira thermophila (strain ATCC 700085 / DSM 6578 / Z-1203) TaxID=869211 RepID=G0GD40_WINT7|nr:cell division FtsK/SpoIIIE [Spirochaeta thermophila DSM 6578]